jgi:sugar lactone lactonase YvrE
MNLTNYPIVNVLEARARLGEGPVWDDQTQRVYWVDIYNHVVHQFIPSTGQDRVFKVGELVSCVALTRSQKLLMTLRHDLAYLDTLTGEVTLIQTVEGDKPNNRFNDGKCDPQGRFWFGSMSRSLEKGQGTLYRYDPDGSLHIMEKNVTLSNGLGWSPDQKTFYYTDSPLKIIYAYDYDPPTGNITRRRIFVDLSHAPSYPDGLTVDAEGCVWSVQWDGWCILRFAPNGRLIQRVPMPVKRPTSCVFGGKEGDLLYVTSASVGLSEPEIQESFYAGDLFCVRLDVTGLPSNRFGG